MEDELHRKRERDLGWPGERGRPKSAKGLDRERKVSNIYLHELSSH